jgi:hypothetical protein
LDPLIEHYQSLIRQDKRTMKNLLSLGGASQNRWRVRHDTSFEEFKGVVLKAGNMKEQIMKQDEYGIGSVQYVLDNDSINIEEGEEEDDHNSPKIQFKELLTVRPYALVLVFQDMLRKAQLEHEEDILYVRKLEKKFQALLADYYYKPEHVNVHWDEAKKSLQQRSIYDELSKSERRKLYYDHIAGLALKYNLPVPDHLHQLLPDRAGETMTTAVSACMVT